MMYVEGIGGATLANDVLRVELLYRNGRGESVPVGELLIPSARVGNIVEGFKQLLQQIEDQVPVK